VSHDHLEDVHVEAVLAHELGHLKRGDLVTNALQRGAEALSTYHSARRVLSRWIEEERECAADALACRQFSGSRGDYVRALAALDAQRPRANTLHLALRGRGDLVRRRHRLASPPDPGRARAHLAAAITVLLALGALAARPPGVRLCGRASRS
jgi:beta-lactamase regulating signal transducer with metallopeptidase domain